jgi:choline dehydrogenase-like flavoprotein
LNPVDTIVVGSGPAGVSVTAPLLEAGCQVLMVDGGGAAISPTRRQPYIDARLGDSAQWKWMIGQDYLSLAMREATSPKLRIPDHRGVFQGHTEANRIAAEGVVAVGSLAAGGLSNSWGCGVAALTPEETAHYPCDPADLALSFQRVALRVGVSGGVDDDLSEFFGLDAWSHPPIPMDAIHAGLWARYARRRTALHRLGFRLGRARVAALSEDRPPRLACDRSGNCLWGCARGALYTAAQDLATLRQNPRLDYRPGTIVERLERAGRAWRLDCRDAASGALGRMTARRVLLAAGTLGTTRLALQALGLRDPRRLLSCPTAAFMLWVPRHLGRRLTPAFGFGQLSFSQDLGGDTAVFGSTFSVGGIPATELVRHMPLNRRSAVELWRALMGSCVVGNAFFPGELSDIRVCLTSDDRLRIFGGYDSRTQSAMARASSGLRRAFARLGAYLLPGSFQTGLPGSDIHYAGTMPMRAIPASGETDPWGEVCGLPGLHAVDGACLPILPGKSHTLAIMANADRVGRQLAKDGAARDVPLG